jgi:hypothetical protein
MPNGASRASNGRDPEEMRQERSYVTVGDLCKELGVMRQTL